MDFKDEYLKYINFDGKPSADFESLKKLQFLHMCSFPFENLNPLFGKPVLLDSDSLINKFLKDYRGGYCFEQNLFYLNALKSFGFDAKPLLGRVHSKEKIFGRTHMLLMVKIDGKRYVSDTGFGGLCAPQPLWMDTEQIQKTVFGDYKITKDDNRFYLNIWMIDKWQILYSFDLIDPVWSDFEVGNWYTSTSPDSHFTRRLTISKIDHSGRFSLHDFQFSRYSNSEIVERHQLGCVRELKETIESKFGISVDGFENFEQRMQKILDSSADAQTD